MKRKILRLTATCLVTAVIITSCSNKKETENSAKADVAKQKVVVSGKSKSGNSSETVTYTSSTTNNAKVSQKKGWSKAAKYGVAGTATGAVLGAVINKKDPVRGAVVGAVVLGGGGYIYGRSQDKKDGRVNN